MFWRSRKVDRGRSCEVESRDLDRNAKGVARSATGLPQGPWETSAVDQARLLALSPVTLTLLGRNQQLG